MNLCFALPSSLYRFSACILASPSAMRLLKILSLNSSKVNTGVLTNPRMTSKDAGADATGAGDEGPRWGVEDMKGRH